MVRSNIFPVWVVDLPDGKWTFLGQIDIAAKMADRECAASKFYFDPNISPGNDNVSWKSITVALQKACYASGASFCNAGSSRKGSDHHRLRCTHYSVFRNQSNHATWRTKGISGHENLAYRPESLQNSKRHARGKSGQTGVPKQNVITRRFDYH